MPRVPVAVLNLRNKKKGRVVYVYRVACVKLKRSSLFKGAPAHVVSLEEKAKSLYIVYTRTHKYIHRLDFPGLEDFLYSKFAARALARSFYVSLANGISGIN